MSSPNATDDLPPVSRRPGAPNQEPAPHPADPLPDRVGRYEILDVLGSGGMGVVYRARQDNPRREVALKVIRPGTASAEALRRFEHEAQVLGRLHHPGIAQIYEAGQADTGHGPQPFFAMELVADAKPLTHYADERPLDTRQRLELLVKVCEAVQHAHQKGVIHRDLKPGNILVQESGQPKVLDFGVARVTNADLQATSLHTDVGQLVGTLPYMSPEQVAGDPDALDTRSDVYALGVIGYELLTGRLPHDLKGKSIPEAARTITDEEPTRLSSVNRVFRGDLDTIVAKALEKDRERRYQSASDLAADIGRYLRDEPIAARKAGTLYQLGKFARRNKAVVGGVAAVLIALTLGVIGTTVGLFREREARAAAEYETARVAMQRGLWREALQGLDRAVQAGHPDSVGLRLDRVKALNALQEVQAARAEIERLAEQTDLGQYAGQVLLWQANLSWSRIGGEQALDLVRQALDKGLPEADEAYARSMLASTTSEAVRLLQQALDKDPWHRDAHVMLGILLLTLGRMDEARQQLQQARFQFPEDASLKLGLAILKTLDNDKPAALTLLEEVKGSLGETVTALVREVVEFLDAVRDYEQKTEQEWSVILQKIQQRLVTAAPFFPLNFDVRALAGGDIQGISFRLPPVLEKSFARFFSAVVAYSSGNTERTLADLAALFETHPEGCILFLRGYALFTEGRHEEAEKVLAEAARTSAVVPIRRQALITAAGCTVMRRRTKPPDTEQLRQRGAGYMHEYRDGSPLTPLWAFRATDLAWQLGECDLARLYIKEWERVAPQNIVGTQLARAKIDFSEGFYFRAIEACKRVLAENPTDRTSENLKKMHDAARDLLKRATEKLREQLKTLDAP